MVTVTKSRCDESAPYVVLRDASSGAGHPRPDVAFVARVERGDLQRQSVNPRRCRDRGESGVRFAMKSISSPACGRKLRVEQPIVRRS
jgi:hypothetical protein